MRNRTTLRIALCCGVLWAALAPTPLCGQIRIIPQATLDSLAHPATAKGAAAMRFERTHIDAGRIGEDDTPSVYTFAWRNEGKTPLVITRVVTTCGCAVATYDKQPVKAAGRSAITVTYHPKGHPGSFQRRIFVYTQLSDKLPTAILELTGTVTPSERLADDYPYAMGVLRLKQRTVRFADNGKPQSERIECLNDGDKALRLSYEKQLTPAGISFACEPETLEPGQRGDLVVRYAPAEVARKLPQRIPLLLWGLDVAPSQRTIRVLIGETE